jgi:predicted metal-dependent hydrolase
MIKVVEFNGRKIEIEIASTKSLRSSVKIKNGKVMMNLSRLLMGRKRVETIDKFLTWADKRLAKVTNDFVLPVYESGGVVLTHNKMYSIVVEESRHQRLRTSVSAGGEILLQVPLTYPLTAAKLKDLVEKIIIKDQAGYLCETIDELNQLYFQEQYNSSRFKRTKSRFGSCSSKRNINIAYRLLFAPREVFRYVCVHELAHLKEMNHSKRFWAHVSCAMPEYKEHEKWLRDSGFMLG